MSVEDDPANLNGQRRHLHDAIAAVPKLDPELPDGAYLAGWVLMAEYVDPDGSRWWVTRRGTDGGEKDLMPWTEKGYLQHALDRWRASDLGRELDDRHGEASGDDS